jgi:hypothetical protein
MDAGREEMVVPYKDKDRKREYQREWFNKLRVARMEKGVCEVCEGEVFSKNLCVKHLLMKNNNSKKWSRRNKEYQTKKSFSWREMYKKEGRCYKCGIQLHPEMDSGYMSCSMCAEKRKRGK